MVEVAGDVTVPSAGGPTVARAGGLFSRERRALTAGLVLVMTLIAFEALAVATAMPVVEEDLGGLRLYGLVFSAFMLANIVGIAFAGRRADIQAPAGVFALGLVLFGVGLVVSGVAPSMAVVVAGRTIQGFGAGAVSTVAYVAIGRGYDESLRPKMFAMLSTAWVVPGLVGPGIAGAVAEHVGWRWVFLGLLPLLPLVAALTLAEFRRLVPTSAPDPSQQTSVVLAIWLALGTGAALLGVSMRPVWVGVPLAAVGFAVAFVSLRRLLPAGTFRAAIGLPAAIATVGLANVAFGGSEAFLPFTLTDVRGQSPTVAGLALTVATLSWTVSSWLQARMASTWSARSMAVGGLWLVLVGLVGVIAITFPGVPVVIGTIAWGVCGAGMGLTFPTISLAVLAEAGEDSIGSASAAMNLATVLGIAAGAGVGGAIVASGESLGWDEAKSVAIVFGVMAAACVVGLLAANRLRRVPTQGPRAGGAG